MRAIDVARIERLAALELQHRGLPVLEFLIVVALGRGDRRMSEQITDLRQWHAALDEPRRVLVTEIVPVQVGRNDWIDSTLFISSADVA